MLKISGKMVLVYSQNISLILANQASGLSVFIPDRGSLCPTVGRAPIVRLW